MGEIECRSHHGMMHDGQVGQSSAPGEVVRSDVHWDDGWIKPRHYLRCRPGHGTTFGDLIHFKETTSNGAMSSALLTCLSKSNWSVW